MNLNVELVGFIEKQLDLYSLTDSLSFGRCYVAVTRALNNNPTVDNYWGYVMTVIHGTIAGIIAEAYEKEKKTSINE